MKFRRVRYRWLAVRVRRSEVVRHLIVLLLELADAFLGAGQLDGDGRVVAAGQLVALLLDELLLLLEHELERLEPLELDEALLLVLLLLLFVAWSTSAEDGVQ